MKRIQVKQINDHIWLMNDHDEATGYVVVGKDKALVIDTMNGYEDVKAVAESLTSLPLRLVNTHGHPDHIYGNIYFEEAYMNPADLEVAERFLANEEFMEAIEKTGLKPAKFLPLQDEQIIDLGDLELQVYFTPGHTPGGIVLLDRKDRIIFTGDTIIEQTWMQLPESISFQILLKSLERVQNLRDEFDYILCGHSRDLEDASLCEEHLRAVKEIIAGEITDDEEYEWFGGKCMDHPYGEQPRRIVYDLNHDNMKEIVKY